ncbi:hypothetical protein HYC85_030266 [Camellia sinensis]|uniref:Uncharacterized protein n=1 Tax=Camellia sinensis TaxID=4442 RepID=A0A7J7G121_CAMSI|nr:hypothetical protein HYC85_030266 [Camellia sinensis]
MIFSRTVKTPKTSTGMAALLCKKKGQKMAKEGSGIYKAQKEKYSSTELMRDQKYAYLQNCKNPKTVYKHARNAMQDRGQKWL